MSEKHKCSTSSSTLATRLLSASLALLVVLAAAPFNRIGIANANPRRSGPMGTVEFQVFPSDARVEIYVDDQLAGVTPLAGPLTLPVGERRYRVVGRGYIDFSDTINIRRGRNHPVEVDLLPIAGIVRIDTSGGTRANVIIDGEPMGETPFDQDVSIGERMITLTAPGFLPHNEQIRIEALREYDLNVTLEPDGGDRTVGWVDPLAHGGSPAGMEGPLHHQWWFWVGTGAVSLSIAAITTGLLISNRPVVEEADTTILMAFR